jgi:DNA-binding transcriptional LysR family regulator
MELRQLRAFAEVARTGTFRAAAVRLHLTQPALWQQVRSLQDDLGVALFERAGRRVRITRAGAQLLERADGVLAAADRLREVATGLREGREGLVSLASPAPPIELVLAEAIGAFARAHPSIRLELHDVGVAGRSSVDALVAGEVDLAVAARQPELDGFRLFRAHVVVAVADRHPWARRRRVAVEQLRGEPLLTSPDGSLSRGLLERACVAAGFAPDIRLASASPGVLVALARSGYGIAVLADDAATATGARRTAMLTDAHGPLATEAWLHWRPGGPLAPCVALFVDHVRRRDRRPH